MNVVFQIVCAAILLLSALAASFLPTARRGARDYLRLAALLYAALALALAQPWWPADGAVLIVLALAPPALALATASAFAGSPNAVLASLVLVLSLAAGIAAAASAVVLLTAAPLVAALCAILAIAARAARRQGVAIHHMAIGALALFASLSALFAGGGARASLALFSAVGLLGMALGLRAASGARVEQQRSRQAPLIDLRRH